MKGKFSLPISEAREIELQINAGWVEWRYVGAANWTQLFEVPADGDDGREIELQTNAGWVEWRYVGAAQWTQLFEIPTASGGTSTAVSDTNYSVYLQSVNAAELITTNWKVENYNERIGEFKATVVIRDTVAKTMYHLQSILGFDHIDMADKQSIQSNVITNATVTITLSVNATTNYLEVQLTGMPTNLKNIHLCFHRCVLGVDDVPFDDGILYNNPALKDLRNLAPEGYRVATLNDINELVEYLGGIGEAGGELKTTDIWNTPNTDATNSKGFSALPAGYRDALGLFKEKLAKARIWFDNR